MREGLKRLVLFLYEFMDGQTGEGGREVVQWDVDVVDR